ncbi:MAG: hypothetical protein U5N55_13805 [Cypionkella sp.]|nr:hypothetical protein [Cypionkella sp.]
MAPPNGTIWLNSTTGEVKVQSGGAAVVLTAGGAALTDGNKGDISVSAVGTSWQINAGAVGNTQMAVMASGSFKARASAGTGAPEDITPTAAAALLPVFDAASKGLVPASGGGSTAFLRADGTWAAPAGGGGGIGTLADLGVTATAAELNAMDGVTAAGTALLQAADPAAQLAALGIGKVILNIAKLETGSSFTRNASTDVVFGPTLTYTPVRSDSRFLIMASFSAQIAQSGGDNDARGKIKLIVQHGAGLYTSGNVLPENNDNIGGINYGADPSSNAQMSIIADTNVRNNAGNLVLRYWGSVSADGTAGYAALLTVYGSPTILVMEYI